MTFNGSYSFNENETIFENPLDKEDVKQIIQNGEEMGHPVVLATKDRTEANGLEEDLVEYFSIANQRIKLATDFEELSKDEVFQIMMAGGKDEYKAMLKDTKRAAVAAWWPKAVDIIPSDGGKGVAVEKVLEY